MSTQQWIALGIFILSYGLIISEKVNRTIASILGAVLAFIFVLGPKELLHYENWETILFVFGMMTVIETMNSSGFFRWLGLHSARWVKLDPLKLFFLFPFIAAFLSAFVDSITVMLFMSTLTLEVAGIIGMNPLPLILAEICAANIGGASTMVGDPPNVILGTYFQLPFMAFAKNTGVIAWVGFFVNAVFFIWFYKQEIFSVRARLIESPKWVQEQIDRLHPREAIQDKRLFAVGLIGAGKFGSMYLAQVPRTPGAHQRLAHPERRVSRGVRRLDRRRGQRRQRPATFGCHGQRGRHERGDRRGRHVSHRQSASCGLSRHGGIRRPVLQQHHGKRAARRGRECHVHGHARADQHARAPAGPGNAGYQQSSLLHSEAGWNHH